MTWSSLAVAPWTRARPAPEQGCLATCAYCTKVRPERQGPCPMCNDKRSGFRPARLLDGPLSFQHVVALFGSLAEAQAAFEKSGQDPAAARRVHAAAYAVLDQMGLYGFRPEEALPALLRRLEDDHGVEPKPKPPTLEEIYRRARAAEGDLPPPEPPVPGDVRVRLEGLVQRRDLGQLLLDFQQARAAAAASPGRAVQGNQILGAPAEYHEPSEAELVLAETGRAVDRVLRSADAAGSAARLVASVVQAGADPADLAYDYYAYDRVDVVGSGRFHYPRPPERNTTSVLRALIEAPLATTLDERLGAGLAALAERPTDTPTARRAVLRDLAALLGPADGHGGAATRPR